MDKHQQIIIIGAGVFGLSTALRLIQEGYTSVTVLDRAVPPVPDGSSVDISRVIRFDYGDAVYARMGKEAFDLWKTPEYSEAFHQTPCMWLTQESSEDQIVQPAAHEYSVKTRQILTDMGEPWTHVPTPEAAKERFPMLTGKLAVPGFDAFVNEAAGWADAALAIARLAARCASAGVGFITGKNGQVEEFEKAADGTVTAVRTATGARVTGDRFIVATGAWTASLVPAWNSMVAAAQIVGYMRLTPEEMIQLKDMPIYFNFSTGFFCFPAHQPTGYLKVACHSYGYTNSSEQGISAPPKLPPSSRANFIPEDGVQRLTAGMRDMMPQFASRGFEKVGLCWYNDTPTGDFILDYHPEHKNLFIATGGSGHAFKFLPNIGKYAVGCFERKLSADLLDKFKFPLDFRGRQDAFKGDGSRGGPERRELLSHEQTSFGSALKNATPIAKQSKL
ncbi:putative fructosyl amino acid oxidase [Aspergillus steynii IBT 23096]|uniref:Putative fructosyl amino acid oxidase n=1 Tax=Aspergillus steynii IBT 23096 TaxID=1392250 RepID=A0A2I2GL13_9EURO|nr:putative fructosyl amino acid oxidase [Aspergillus steynii IBT 23096]PLB53555.1 putative fructosyl amino acid oxidase [Aspergillus steynii IBT 23096]